MTASSFPARLGVTLLVALPCAAQVQEQEIAAADAMADALFGRSRALEGDVMVVGAETDNATGQVVGAAYVFERRASGWQQTQELLPQVPVFGMRFGSAVAIAGDWIAVGAAAENNYTGAVYLFQRQGGSFLQHQRITALDASSQANFGEVLPLHQDR